MLNEPTITIGGNLASDPELRFTAAGQPVASFSVASNPRSLNRQTGEWEAGTTVFLRVTAWRDLAENICESLRRGDPVIVVGRFRQRTWTDDDGRDRRADDVQADTVAVPLDRRRVRMVKVTRERAAEPGSESPAGEPGEWDAAGASEPAAGRTEPGSGHGAGAPGSGPEPGAGSPAGEPGGSHVAGAGEPAAGRTEPGSGSRGRKRASGPARHAAS